MRAIWAGGRGAGVGAEEEIEVSAGAQRVDTTFHAGLPEFLGPGGDPLVGGQDVGWGKFAAGEAGVAGILGPAFDSSALGGVLAALLGLLGVDLHDRAADRGAQRGRGQGPGAVQHLGFGGAGLLGIQERGGAGDDTGLVLGHDPGPERRLGARQPDLQGVRQVQYLIGADLGQAQRRDQLAASELIPSLRARTAADQLRDRGMLTGARIRLDPVPGADHPDQFIVGGAGVPVVVSGGVIGEQAQAGAAGGDVQRLRRRRTRPPGWRTRRGSSARSRASPGPGGRLAPSRWLTGNQ